MTPRPKSSRLRKFWALARGTVFLNHGSFGACPKAILKLQHDLRAQMEAEPVQFLWRRYEERLEPSRNALARFICARECDLAFVANATTGVNAVLRSTPLRSGDQILTTNLDYNACHNVLVESARQSGAKLVTAEVPFPVRSPDQILEAVLSKVTPRTRLAMIDHVTSATAMVLPVTRLVRELESRGVATLVDGAHAPGTVPVNVSRLKPAYYTANLHKWVCAPKGAGFLWVREDKQKQMNPPVISHGNNTPRPGYTPFQDRFDWTGTFDPTAWFCVGAALDWMGKLLPDGWPALREHNHRLALQARQILCERLSVPAPCPASFIGSMATLPLPDRFQGREKSGKIDPEQLSLYDDFGIEVPLFRIGKQERRYFRVSAQVYNTVADYERLAEAFSKL